MYDSTSVIFCMYLHEKCLCKIVNPLAQKEYGAWSLGHTAYIQPHAIAFQTILKYFIVYVFGLVDWHKEQKQISHRQSSVSAAAAECRES